MNTKRSAVLLLGLLLMAMFAVLSQTSDTKRPTCPPLTDDMLQSMLLPTAWVRANWNANTKLWEIQCNEIDALANMPRAFPANAANSGPRKTPPKRRPNE